ncbi:hypothetical protein TELCIR_01667 [Teladorsagia circumcincta]|uniref:Chitin-binding type-2 domain-containing protein n=1 Tax=Teladorsagia circumcincta TaxID=45464 RepID=A0A2G9V1B7_TELCI|nr:hypothetical protein TELCIR_01667 [Teladorsagia circumcincta]
MQPAHYEPKCYEGATRPSPKECSVYEECVRGEWTRKACPYDHGFYNGQCVVGNCAAAGKHCRESSGVDGYRRVENDCSKFYQCVHGKRYYEKNILLRLSSCVRDVFVR